MRVYLDSTSFEDLHCCCEAIALTRDHNVLTNREERDRVSSHGGAYVYEKHLGVNGAEGEIYKVDRHTKRKMDGRVEVDR